MLSLTFPKKPKIAKNVYEHVETNKDLWMQLEVRRFLIDLLMQQKHTYDLYFLMNWNLRIAMILHLRNRFKIILVENDFKHLSHLGHIQVIQHQQNTGIWHYIAKFG